jgi:hypothetical protein
MPPTGALRPGGPVQDVAMLDDQLKLVAYAAVPGAGALVTLQGNQAPSCGYGWFRPPPVKVTAGRVTRVPIRCFDANGDALSYSLASAPKHGTIEGFGGDDALYRADAAYTGADSFGVSASDGGATGQGFVEVDVQPPGSSGDGPKVTLASTRLRMDRRGRVALRLRCPATEPTSCDTTVRLRRAAKTVARGTITIRHARTKTLRVTLAKRVRRLVRRARHAVRLSARISAGNGAGKVGRTTARVSVRR